MRESHGIEYKGIGILVVYISNFLAFPAPANLILSSIAAREDYSLHRRSGIFGTLVTFSQITHRPVDYKNVEMMTILYYTLYNSRSTVVVFTVVEVLQLLLQSRKTVCSLFSKQQSNLNSSTLVHQQFIKAESSTRVWDFTESL